MLLLVDHLHREGVLIEPAAGNRAAVFHYDADRTINRLHHRRWLEQRALQRGWCTCRADVAEVRGDTRSAAVDAVTRGACTLAFEELTAAGGIADLHGGAGGIEAGADKCDDAAPLRCLQRERRHRGAGNAGRDDLRQILIRGRAAELPPTQVDAGDLVAGRTMTQLALSAVQA